MAEADMLYSWLSTRAWPLWLHHGVNWTAGAFNESLTLDGYRSMAEFRRLRVLARQIYVFSEAHRHGLPRADEAVTLGLTYLSRHALREDGGYAWRFSLKGDVIDDRRDLYDHAFVLLALSTAAGIGATGPLHAQALALDQFITTHLRHSYRGYLEQLPPLLPRRQNPHMHLLEAYLAAAEMFGDELFLERADELVHLFQEHLYCARSATIPEYYDNEFQIQQDGGRHVWEPGHHCEWIWLLDWYERLRGTSQFSSLRVALWQRVLAAGFDPRREVLINEVWSDGTHKDLNQRLWPQTERLKSAILMSTFVPEEPERSTTALQGFLRTDGTWYEYRNVNGACRHSSVPASSLYHLTCSILFSRQRLLNMRAPLPLAPFVS